MKAHEIPDAIQWYEGLLLTPQHFQQLSSRHEALVQYTTSLIEPFCWGLSHFKHHAISLPAGKLQVLELEGVMPDGLVVSHQSDTAENQLEIDLTKYADQMTYQSVTVYLAVAARHGYSSNGDAQRYGPFKSTLVPDEVSGGKPREIYRLKPRLNLLVADSLPSKYVGFPLVKVINRDSCFALDDEFIPPVLTVPVKLTAGDPPVAAAQRLADMCSQTVQRVRKRAMYLADEQRIDREQTRTRDEATIRNLMLSLVGCLPQIEAVLKTGFAHPITVYLALCGMAGQLAMMGVEMVPPNFSPYNHNDLYGTFKPVLEFINRTLDQGIPLSYKSFPFQYREGVFELHFDGSWMNKRLAIAIKSPRGMLESEVIRWGETCLIGSQTRIELMRKNRMSGARREYVNRVGDIVPTKGVALFSLTVDPNFIEPEVVLQIVNQEGLRPSEILLHVMDS